MLISHDVAEIATIIQDGGVVAYPTEAVFGLGCDPHNQAAVQRLIALKQRDIDKGVIVIAADVAQVKPYISQSSTNLERSQLEQKLSSQQAHPTTWLIPASATVPPLIRGQYHSVAVRISTHSACQKLCLAIGHPIVSSSANPAGLTAATDIDTICTYFPAGLDAIFDAPLGNYQQTSVIRDAVSNQVLR